MTRTIAKSALYLSGPGSACRYNESGVTIVKIRRSFPCVMTFRRNILWTTRCCYTALRVCTVFDILVDSKTTVGTHVCGVESDSNLIISVPCWLHGLTLKILLHIGKCLEVQLFSFTSPHCRSISLSASALVLQRRPEPRCRLLNTARMPTTWVSLVQRCEQLSESQPASASWPSGMDRVILAV